jgi:ABC-2 type transport system permease protein
MQFINKSYFYTYLALMRRDMLVIKQRLRSALTDSGVQLVMHVLLYGSLFPALGISTDLIAPLFVSSQAISIIFLGMGFGIRILFDINFSRFIDYRLTLPIPKRWLFASYLTYFVIEGVIITTPLLLAGIIFLGTKFKMIAPNWPLFIITYLISFVLIGMLFLGLSTYYKFNYFMENLWPRRLTFLFSFSPTFVLWSQIQGFSPFFAKLMLLNPMTYLCEGLRATIIGGPAYISGYLCTGMMVLWSCLFALLVRRGVSKRLDPV